MSDRESVVSQCQKPPCPLDNPPIQDAAWRAEMRAHFACGAHSQIRRDAVAFVRMMEAEFKRATGQEM